MRVIHRDEIRHVAFGLTWLQFLEPEGQTDWDAYVERNARNSGGMVFAATNSRASSCDDKLGNSFWFGDGCGNSRRFCRFMAHERASRFLALGGTS